MNTRGVLLNLRVMGRFLFSGIVSTTAILMAGSIAALLHHHIGEVIMPLNLVQSLWISTILIFLAGSLGMDRFPGICLSGMPQRRGMIFGDTHMLKNVVLTVLRIAGFVLILYFVVLHYGKFATLKQVQTMTFSALMFILVLEVFRSRLDEYQSASEMFKGNVMINCVGIILVSVQVAMMLRWPLMPGMTRLRPWQFAAVVAAAALNWPWLHMFAAFRSKMHAAGQTMKKGEATL